MIRWKPGATILIVCHANTARSVMAQEVLKRMLAERGYDGAIRVRSGGVGIYARDGMLASLDARIVLREIGIDLGDDGPLSTDLRRHRQLVADADVVVTMTEEQKTIVRGFLEAEGRRVVTLRECAGESGDIADPATLGEEAFRASRDEIQRCLDLGIDRLLALLAG